MICRVVLQTMLAQYFRNSAIQGTKAKPPCPYQFDTRLR